MKPIASSPSPSASSSALPVGFELGEDRVGLGLIEIVEAAHHRRRGVSLEICREKARGREDPGTAGDQQRRHLGVACQRVRVHGTGAAEADEHEVTWVVPSLHRDEVKRVDHRGICDLDDPVRSLGDGEAERPGAALLDRPGGAFDVEPDLAAEEVRRIEPAEDDVRVGHGGLDAAAAIADRAGIGARTLRPHAQEPARVDPRDRAAAGPDLDEIDDGRPHGIPRE